MGQGFGCGTGNEGEAGAGELGAVCSRAMAMPTPVDGCRAVAWDDHGPWWGLLEMPRLQGRKTWSKRLGGVWLV